MKKLVSVDRIIVHTGKSHTDEILAVALAEASTSDGKVVPVFRRDPTADELQDNRTLVLDVGGKLDDWSMNFDHHQLPRDAEPECAFSLLASELDVYSQLSSFFAWFDTWRDIDAKGPFAWAKAHGVDWENVSGLLSPVDNLVHDWWEEAHDDIPVDEALLVRLQKQGRKLLEAAAKFEEFAQKADALGMPKDVEGIKVFDFRDFPAKESQAYGGAYAKAKGVKGGVIVSQDDRGPGYAFFRREDDPKVDFSRCAGKPYTGFAHAGGFILKTVDRNVSVCEVVAAAKV